LKNLAIIGASGMLGTDLVEVLSEAFTITQITKENYEKHLHKKFDIVVNANGNSKRFWANEHIVEDFTLSTLSVYKSVFDFSFSQYIYISSSDMYENHSNPTYTKESQTPLIKNLTPYGFHKYMSESIVQKYVKNFIIIRPSMILGRHMKKGPIYDILNNKKLFISKNAKLQMITAEEIGKIIVNLIASKVTCEVYNCGGRGVVSFATMENYFNKPILFDQKGEKQVYQMNVEKLHAIFPLRTSNQYLQYFLESLQ